MLTGRSYLVNVVGRDSNSLLSWLILATSRPSNVVELLRYSPFIALMVNEVLMPDVSRSYFTWFNYNVALLQLSRKASA